MVNMATSMVMVKGIVITLTNKPINRAVPPTISVRVTSQAVKCGKGAFINVSSFAKA
jgi:hypothetical protein